MSVFSIEDVMKLATCLKMMSKDDYLFLPRRYEVDKLPERTSKCEELFGENRKE